MPKRCECGSVTEALLYFLAVSGVGLAFASGLHFVWDFDVWPTAALFVGGLALLTTIWILLYFRRLGKTADAWQKAAQRNAKKENPSSSTDSQDL